MESSAVIAVLLGSYLTRYVITFYRNMMKIKDGMGEKLAVVSNLVGTAIICLCQAFPMGWELTLACFSVVPFSIAASVVLSNVSETD